MIALICFLFSYLTSPKFDLIYSHNLRDYKKLSWVWGWDRKICSKDHHLASQGLSSADKMWSRGLDYKNHLKCVGGIEKYFTRIIVWHQEGCWGGDNKFPSWIWGRNRKICRENHHLASQGFSLDGFSPWSAKKKNASENVVCWSRLLQIIA